MRLTKPQGPRPEAPSLSGPKGVFTLPFWIRFLPKCAQGCDHFEERLGLVGRKNNLRPHTKGRVCVVTVCLDPQHIGTRPFKREKYPTARRVFRTIAGVHRRS